MAQANTIWVHPEYSLTTLRKRSVKAAIVANSINAEEVSHSSTVNSVRIPYLSLAGAFCIGFAIALAVHFSSLSKTHNVGDYDYASVERETFALASRDAYLSQISLERKRQLAGQVHYVLDIIQNSRKKPEDAKALAHSIVFESQKADVDPFYVAAVVKSESTFNHRAVSIAGAQGLMQILPTTGQFITKSNDFIWRGEKKLQDPQYNLKLGIAYLKQLEDLFKGNREHALIAYNWGPGNLKNALKNKTRIPGSTVQYARTIMKTHKRWRADYNSKVDAFQYYRIDNVA